MIISSTEDRASKTRDWAHRRRLLVVRSQHERKNISGYLENWIFYKYIILCHIDVLYCLLFVFFSFLLEI